MFWAFDYANNWLIQGVLYKLWNIVRLTALTERDYAPLVSVVRKSRTSFKGYKLSIN